MMNKFVFTLCLWINGIGLAVPGFSVPGMPVGSPGMEMRSRFDSYQIGCSDE
jgi:hypothetical protein